MPPEHSPRLHSPDGGPANPAEDQAASPDVGRPKPTAAAIEPLQIGARDAARLAGVSEPTWWRLHSAGKVPLPNRLGGRTLWRVEELKSWISAGCPPRAAWAALRASAGKGKGC
jgi:predicted DNA-binding transcriptional regulator AlpA